MSDNREKIIERVRRLLAMAGDVSSPNEAAIAASRARKLMDKYQLSQKDFIEKSQYTASETGDPRRSWPRWEQNIAVGVAKLNDCQVKFQQAYQNKKVLSFQGEEGDVRVCEYLFTYLVEAGNRLCKAYLKQVGKSGLAEANAFKLGFGSALQQRLKEMARERDQEYHSTGTGLMVLKKELVQKHFGAAAYRQAKRSAHHSASQSTVRAGHQAGQDIRIHTGVGGTDRTCVTAGENP
jgi:hypothetical protein